MSFLGLFTFNAPYLPWVILGLSFLSFSLFFQFIKVSGFESLLGHSVNLFDLLGIFIGHLYYYLEDVYPKISGVRYLETPRVFKYLLEQQGIFFLSFHSFLDRTHCLVDMNGVQNAA